ncbi:uncharacterized protein LOC120122327 [Hibiscus syriacus]|uniref:uncharacterized protein LOC120122327 n=1 Tax=Hibiscus syriacus TaxID=106335 RepID=UPI001922ED1A|nr:uncharacterized protein LOC120122327 [Hibiscus syriacus]
MLFCGVCLSEFWKIELACNEYLLVSLSPETDCHLSVARTLVPCSIESILQQIVDQAYACRKCLTEIVDFEISCYDKDQLTYYVSKKLTTALKAIGVSGVYDHQSYCDLERALARCSWRFRVARLLDALEKGLEKPSIQQIDWHLKEGNAMNILPEDYFRLKLSELKDIGLQWAGRADKVAADSGALG